MATTEGNFLEKLMKAFNVLEKQSSVNTEDFIDAIEKLFPVFDHLGNPLYIFSILWQWCQTASRVDYSCHIRDVQHEAPYRKHACCPSHNILC